MICILGSGLRPDYQLEQKVEEVSGSSRISSHSIRMIIDKLLMNRNRASTSKAYLCIWRQFNKFLMSLDCKPDLWEDRTNLFVGFLISEGKQSCTVKSYVSAIKRTLLNDGYNWKDDRILLTLLTCACRIRNDKVRTRLPISCSLLEMILFEIQRMLKDQCYLELLYKAIFV